MEYPSESFARYQGERYCSDCKRHTRPSATVATAKVKKASPVALLYLASQRLPWFFLAHVDKRGAFELRGREDRQEVELARARIVCAMHDVLGNVSDLAGTEDAFLAVDPLLGRASKT